MKSQSNHEKFEFILVIGFLLQNSCTLNRVTSKTDRENNPMRPVLGSLHHMPLSLSDGTTHNSYNFFEIYFKLVYNIEKITGVNCKYENVKKRS